MIDEEVLTQFRAADVPLNGHPSASWARATRNAPA